MKIKLAQIKIVTGDIEGNFSKIQHIIYETIHNNDADVIVFPELAISGYCCGQLFERQEFILDQEKKIHELFLITPPEICVIVGYASYHGQRKSGLPKLKNSAAIINNGRIQRYDKQLLAISGHHDDNHYFLPGEKSELIPIVINNETHNIGILICEDGWYNDHKRNIPDEMIELGAELLISINQSYFYYGKNEVREQLYRSIINSAQYTKHDSLNPFLLGSIKFPKLLEKFQIPFISVNSVGCGDIGKNIMIFDGNSMIFSRAASIVKKLKSFEEDIQVVDVTKHTHYGQKELDIRENKFKEITDALLFVLKEIYSLNNIQHPQIHLSGGLDSSLVLALTSLVFNKEDIVVITNPSSYNTEKIYKNVEHIVNKLGVKLYVNPIQEIYDKILEVDQKSFGTELSDTAKSCIQATLRTVSGLYNAHRFHSSLISTTNHTELCMGFSTYLDISFAGIIALIADLSKIECYQLCEYLNKVVFKDEIIPESLYNGVCKPSAELPDNQGEDPIDYFIVSGCCCEIIRKNKSKKQLILDFKNKKLTEDYFPVLEMYGNKTIYEYTTLENFIIEVNRIFIALKKSVYKTEQCPPVPMISPYNRGFSRRETLINKYNY